MLEKWRLDDSRNNQVDEDVCLGGGNCSNSSFGICFCLVGLGFVFEAVGHNKLYQGSFFQIQVAQKPKPFE